MTLMSRHRETALLALCGALIAANWYQQPARAATWVAMAAFVAGMALVLVIAARRGDRPKWRDASDALKSGVFLAGLMLTMTLTAALAKSAGLLADVSAGRRISMALLGAFFVVTGNAMPKRLTPLATMACNPSRVQAFQRFSGWIWVLTGVAYSLAWLLLPMHYAGAAAMLALTGGMLVIVSRLVMLFFTPRSA